jgi:hypothetical protein
MSNIIQKQELELALQAEQREVSAGFLKEDNPLDLSPGFQDLCDACRRGDLKVCHQKILEGVNINGRDSFDYSPLILVKFPILPRTSDLGLFLALSAWPFGHKTSHRPPKIRLRAACLGCS